MPNIKFKILILFYFSAVGFLTAAEMEPIKESLEIADSLFMEKKYTESFEIYSSIFDSGKKYSPSMLLKMAYIREGLGDFSMALYYLDYYYQKTADKSVLSKMHDLAASHRLSGYDYSDLEFLISVWQKYRTYILLGLSILVLILTFLLFRAGRKSIYFTGLSFSIFLFLCLLIYLVNFRIASGRGILIQSSNYIMKDPSSGAGLVEVTGKGHRVKVYGKEDAWYEIEWEGNVAWVKEGNLILTRQI